MYVLPLLTFVGQLEPIPDHISKLEQLTVRRIAPGAGDWCAPVDLHHGRELGQAALLRPLAATCAAAQIRLRDRETAHDEHYLVKMVADLTRAIATCPYWDRLRHWAPWLKQHTPTVLEKNAQDLADK